MIERNIVYEIAQQYKFNNNLMKNQNYSLLSIHNLQRLFTKQTVLNTVQFMLNAFLDQSTKQILQKNYKSTHQNNALEPKFTKQVYVIGIKLFLIYKKVLKKEQNIRRFVHDLNYNIFTRLQRSIESASDTFKKFMVIQKGIVTLNMMYELSKKQISQIIQKLSNVLEQVKYSQKTKKIYLLSRKTKQNLDSLTNLLYQTIVQVLKFKYSRCLYNNVISKYKNIKNQYVKIKEQSQNFSQRFLSETSKDNNNQQYFNDFAKQNKKFARCKRSQDNLYNLRKISIAQQFDQINEQPIQKSNNPINQISSNQQISEIIKQIDEISKVQFEGDDKKYSDPSIKILNDQNQQIF